MSSVGVGFGVFTMAVSALRGVRLMVVVGGMLFSGAAYAEYCDMVRCSEPGYVFIPMLTQQTTFVYGTQHCTLPMDGQTFTEDGLPPVNQIVTFAFNRQLYAEQDIVSEIDDFVPAAVDTPVSAVGCTTSWHEPHDDGGYRAGDHVRILGYRTFVSHFTPPGSTHRFTRQLLFSRHHV
jgi:hypothetical protein